MEVVTHMDNVGRNYSFLMNMNSIGFLSAIISSCIEDGHKYNVFSFKIDSFQQVANNYFKKKYSKINSGWKTLSLNEGTIKDGIRGEIPISLFHMGLTPRACTI